MDIVQACSSPGSCHNVSEFEESFAFCFLLWIIYSIFKLPEVFTLKCASIGQVTIL